MAPQKPTSSLRRLNPNIWFLTIGSFLTDVSSEMLNNLIPLFLYNVLGVQTSIIGLIDGIAEATASLVKLFSGTLSDRIGKRKWLTVLGYAISTISKPFLYFATTWEWVLGVRFADRFGKGIRTAPRDALLADSAKSDQRGLSFGLHRGRRYCWRFCWVSDRWVDNMAHPSRCGRARTSHLPGDRPRQHYPGCPGGPGVGNWC